MTFSNPAFYLLFLPIALIGFEICGRFGRRPAIAFLTSISILFYAVWNYIFVFFLLASVLVNFLFSLAIERSAKRPVLQKWWLAAAITVNLSALCYYKYLFPLLRAVYDLGITHHDFGSVILPLGISFFTFTQIAYLIDLKEGMAKREDLLNYALFVTFFPHLIAGPIIHHSEMMPQFSRKGRYCLNPADMAVGLTWFAMGMFKKVMIADRVAPAANQFFAAPGHVAASPGWFGLLCYSMQLYFDFSGYSDMAIGLARMFSIRFPLNFNSPYKASGIIDFWQRWHITLTRYIMAYLYNPVQLYVSRRRLEKGKKVSRRATATLDGFVSMLASPTLFTMFIVGVWHGAGLQFMAFGVVHGIFLIINHAWRIFVPPQSRKRHLMPLPLSVIITYLCVLIGQVFFRANNLHDAFRVFADVLGFHGSGPSWSAAQYLLIATLLLVVWAMPNTQEILGETHRGDEPNWALLPNLRWRPALGWCSAVSVAFLISMFYSADGPTFLYFQF